MSFEPLVCNRMIYYSRYDFTLSNSEEPTSRNNYSILLYVSQS